MMVRSEPEASVLCECETGTGESYDRFGSQVVLDEGEEVRRSSAM